MLFYVEDMTWIIFVHINSVKWSVWWQVDRVMNLSCNMNMYYVEGLQECHLCLFTSRFYGRVTDNFALHPSGEEGEFIIVETQRAKNVFTRVTLKIKKQEFQKTT